MYGVKNLVPMSKRRCITELPRFKKRKKAQREINKIARQIRKILETDPLTSAYNPTFYQKESWWVMEKYLGINWPEMLGTKYILSIGGKDLFIYINSVQPIEDFVHQIYNKLKKDNILTNYLSNKENSYFLENEAIFCKKMMNTLNYLKEPTEEEFY